ncbi:MAG: Histidine kinase, gyrase and HSP90-like ATPase [Anaerocolumna sp.]|jgi:hypothetical protein|nr:Histidine kinase, gyrase and HSP90-like ATPase [Anaerocolumna sp.]
MSFLIIENVTSLIQNSISTNFITKYLGWKKKDKWNVIGILVTLIVLQFVSLALGRCSTYQGVRLFINTSVFMLYSIILLNGSTYLKIGIVFLNIGIKNLVRICILIVVNYLFPLNMPEPIFSNEINRIIIIVISILSYLFLTNVLLRIFKHKKFSLTSIEWLAILLVFLASFIISLLVFEMLVSNPESKRNTVFAICIIAFLITINAICYFLFVNISKKNNEKLYYSFVELQLLEQEKSFLDMRKSYEEIRKIRHDIKNYLECASTLLHNGKVVEAKNYLSSILEKKMNIDMRLVTSKSEIVNAVISSKISICKKNNINFVYEIIGSVEEVPELDLSILLSNLLNNAIEAAMKVENNAEISLKIYDDRNYLVILIGNTINESVLKKNPNLYTTKDDKLQHGIGSLNIKDIVKKHNGMMSIYEEYGKFIVDIWLSRGKNT